MKEDGRAGRVIVIISDGNKISFDVPIVAKEMSLSSKDRLMTEKFTLKRGNIPEERIIILFL